MWQNRGDIGGTDCFKNGFVKHLITSRRTCLTKTSTFKDADDAYLSKVVMSVLKGWRKSVINEFQITLNLLFQNPRFFI